MTKENDLDGKAKEKKLLKARNVNICPLSLSPFFPWNSQTAQMSLICNEMQTRGMELMYKGTYCDHLKQAEKVIRESN